MQTKKISTKSYPWNVWFGRPFSVLLRGRDYFVSSKTIAQTIRNAAVRKGYKVSVYQDRNKVLLRITSSS